MYDMEILAKFMAESIAQFTKTCNSLSLASFRVFSKLKKNKTGMLPSDYHPSEGFGVLSQGRRQLDHKESIGISIIERKGLIDQENPKLTTSDLR